MKRRETTHAERVDMVERHLAGETLSAIAERLETSRYAVRHWWRAYRDHGWVSLEPKPKGPPAQDCSLRHPMVEWDTMHR